MLRKAYYKLIFYKELQMIPATRNNVEDTEQDELEQEQDEQDEQDDSLPPMD